MNNDYWMKSGTISVICGCMFSGKTHELIRRLTVLNYAKKKIIVFKPNWQKYQKNDPKITSRLKNSFPAILINEPQEVFNEIKKQEKDHRIDVIAFDETQFLPLGIFKYLDRWISENKIIIFSGLDKDYYNQYDSLMSRVLVKADTIDKLSAICSLCNQMATRTQRMCNGKEINLFFPKIVPQGLTDYQARCHRCFVSFNESK